MTVSTIFEMIDIIYLLWCLFGHLGIM